jgi:hypothetical protein
MKKSDRKRKAEATAASDDAALRARIAEAAYFRPSGAASPVAAS